MSAVVHGERPQIFALLHWREIEECWLTLSLRGGDCYLFFSMSLFEIDWSTPPPKPRGLGSRGVGARQVIRTAPICIYHGAKRGGVFESDRV